MSKSRELILISSACCAILGLGVWSRTSAQRQTATAGKSVGPAVTMITGQGKKMTLTMQTLPNSRGYQYCELVFNYGDKGSDIYSTSPLAKANLNWWNNLDLKALAKDFGAETVYKNGPQWWSMDEGKA